MKKLLFFIFACVSLFSVDQALEVSIRPSAQIGFTSVAITNADFHTNGSGTLEAIIERVWKYSNTEKSRGQDYKVTGQITSHSSSSAPAGWTIQSILDSPSDGTFFGMPSNSGDFITLPWSDETPVNFIVNLPQAKAGIGEQLLKVLVDSPKHFSHSQDFVIAWTIIAE